MEDSIYNPQWKEGEPNIGEYALGMDKNGSERMIRKMLLRFDGMPGMEGEPPHPIYYAVCPACEKEYRADRPWLCCPDLIDISTEM